MARLFPLTFALGPDDNKSEMRRGAGNATEELIFNPPGSSVAAIAHGEQIKEVAKYGDESGDIGQCRSIQNLIDTGDFGTRLHDSHLLENDFRAARSVEFHRQRD